MSAQKQDNQHEHTFSNYVRIQDVVLKTYLERWTIGRSGERGSGISVLPARYDDNDDYIYKLFLNFVYELYQPIGLVARVFTNGLEDWGSVPGWVIPKTQKMVLDTSLLNTQHHKVWIKGKVEQSRERGVEPSPHENGAFGSPQLLLPTFMNYILIIFYAWIIFNIH